MSDRSAIEWTHATWPFLDGCSDASPGCAHCYAKRGAYRLAHNPNEKVGARFRGLTVLRDNGPQWTGEVRLVPANLTIPLRWRAPRRIFVNSQSDTFHADIPFDHIAAGFGVMAACTRHTFQVLTKRAELMRAWFELAEKPAQGPVAVCLHCARQHCPDFGTWASSAPWPLPNVHLGVSVENRKHGLPRLEHLRATPAAARFVSAEPLLEDLGDVDLTGIDQVIIGGESGPGARLCNVRWVRRLIAQAREQRVRVFVKQLGAQVCSVDPADGVLHMRHPKGGDRSEWPEDLRIREHIAPRGGDAT